MSDLVSEYMDKIQEAMRTTRIKISRETKIRRAEGQLATKMAKDRNDSLYKKMVKYREKWQKYKELIRKKYVARVRSKAKK